MSDGGIWKVETGFWLDGPKFYDEHMISAAQMVFPDPVGILKGREILNGLKEAPRWASVEMVEKSKLSLEGTLVLAYRATGKREGETSYVALCSSTYVHRDEVWNLISHQQTPAA